MNRKGKRGQNLIEIFAKIIHSKDVGKQGTRDMRKQLRDYNRKGAGGQNERQASETAAA